MPPKTKTTKKEGETIVVVETPAPAPVVVVKESKSKAEKSPPAPAPKATTTVVTTPAPAPAPTKPTVVTTTTPAPAPTKTTTKPTVVTTTAPAPKTTTVVQQGAPVQQTVTVVKTKEQEKAEMLAELDREEANRGPGKCRKLIKCLVLFFLIFIAVLMVAIGGIGLYNIFGVSTQWESYKALPAKLVSRILQNVWYILLGLLTLSGLWNIPGVSKYFKFTSEMFGFSWYLLFLGFCLHGGNLDLASPQPAPELTPEQAQALASAGSAVSDASMKFIKAMGWVRGIAGIVLVVVGLVGIIWGLFKKNSAEEEAEEEAAQEEYRRKREAIEAS